MFTWCTCVLGIEKQDVKNKEGTSWCLESHRRGLGPGCSQTLGGARDAFKQRWCCQAPTKGACSQQVGLNLDVRGSWDLIRRRQRDPWPQCRKSSSSEWLVSLRVSARPWCGQGLFDMCHSRTLLTFTTQTLPERIREHILARTELLQDVEEKQTDLPHEGHSETIRLFPLWCLRRRLQRHSPLWLSSVFLDYSDVRAPTAPTDKLSPQNWVTNVPNPGNKEHL